jgi:toxin ParE1/3/4
LWYLNEAESPQAADRFIDEAHEVFAEIVKSPKRFPARQNGLRFWPMKHFPFDVVYSIERDEVVIVSLYHHKRRPKF